MKDEKHMNIAAKEHIIGRSDQEIMRLESLLERLVGRTTTAQVALIEINQAREKHTQSLLDDRATAEQCESAHNQARTVARMAQGTLDEQETIKKASAAQKATREATRVLAHAEQEIAQFETEAQAHEKELGANILAWRAEHEQTKTELGHVRLARAQAIDEAGQQKFTSIQQIYQEKQARVDEAREQLLAASIELQDYHEEAISELADCPELRREIAALLPYEDSTTKMIEVTLYYGKTLLEDAAAVNADIVPTDRIWEYLVIPEPQIRGYPVHLQERLLRLETILKEYRDWQQARA